MKLLASRLSVKNTRHCTLRFTLGLGFGLWLVTASGYHAADEVPMAPAASIDFLAAEIQKTIQPERLEQQRKLYARASQALNKHQLETFEKLLGELADYPLQAYLRAEYLGDHLNQPDMAALRDFLDKEKGTLVGERLRRELLKQLARKNLWADFLSFYQPQNDVGLQCLNLEAMMHSDQLPAALDQVSQIWMTGHFLPQACDNIVAAWENDGRRTDELTWQRIELAMAEGTTRLASRLATSLNKQDRTVVDLWTRVHRSPEQISHGKLPDHAKIGLVVTHAIRRLSAKNPDKAIDLWQKLSSQRTFTEAENSRAWKYIGLSLARSHQAEAYVWLKRIPLQYADTLVLEWKIRTAIRQGDWYQIVADIQSMPALAQSDLRWQFWWAYANEQLGNTIEAEGVYHYLAGRRDFYGFLAADRLNLPYAFEDRPLEISVNELNAMANHPSAARARELLSLGKIIEARREWAQLTTTLDEQGMLAASKLAQLLGWHDRAILTMGKTEYRDDVDLRFPVLMQDAVLAWSAKHNVEPALTYAIIRRESAFVADARSPVGARGLMQLMPATARNIARQLRVPYHGTASLLSSDTNLNLGTGYLGQMLKNLDDQPALAAAAYNAGPHRVRSWRPEQAMDAVRWVETIPFNETREYVSNVLAYTVIYQHKLENSYTRLTDRMPPVEPRTLGNNAQATLPEEENNS
jgi:soluble lytic murein transglycosylase